MSVEEISEIVMNAFALQIPKFLNTLNQPSSSQLASFEAKCAKSMIYSDSGSSSIRRRKEPIDFG
jgi:hypothetical protein